MSAHACHVCTRSCTCAEYGAGLDCVCCFEPLITLCPKCGNEGSALSRCANCGTFLAISVTLIGKHDDTHDDTPMRLPCPSCPDGNEWSMNGPTGRACRTCGGKGYVEKEIARCPPAA